MFLGLFVGVWVARYLGPEDFGILSYVIAFTNLFNPLRKLGLDGIISREVAKNESDIDEILTTGLFFKFIGGLLIVVVVSSYMYFSKNNITYFYISIIISIALTAKSFEIIEFYFRAKVKGKLVSIANVVSILLSSFLKILFILGGFSVVFFSYSNLVEALSAGIILYLLFRYHKINNISFKKLNFVKGFELLKESWPLIFSGFFAIVYLNIDQVMIEEMIGSYELGQYSAAVRISSAFYVVIPILAWSLQTSIVNAKKNNEKQYWHRLKMLAILTSLLAYTISIPLAIFSDEIIGLLYGIEYLEAGEILMIHVFSIIFIFNRLTRGLFVLNESLFLFSLIINIVAALINIILNYIFIEQYGAIAAAWTTLVSYAIAYTLSGFFYLKTKHIAIIQIKALFLIDLKYFIKSSCKGEF